VKDNNFYKKEVAKARREQIMSIMIIILFLIIACGIAIPRD